MKEQVFRVNKENLVWLSGLLVSRGQVVCRNESIAAGCGEFGIKFYSVDTEGKKHEFLAEEGDLIHMRTGIRLTEDKFYVVKKEY